MGPYKKINKITETQSLGRERETTKNNWESKLSQRVITNRRRSLCTCPISHRRMNNLTHTHTKKKHVVAKITRGSGFGNRQKFELSATPSTQKKKKGEGRWEQEKKRHIKMHHDAEELQQASGINDQRRQQSPMDQICNIFQK